MTTERTYEFLRQMTRAQLNLLYWFLVLHPCDTPEMRVHSLDSPLTAKWLGSEGGEPTHFYVTTEKVDMVMTIHDAKKMLFELARIIHPAIRPTAELLDGMQITE